MSRRRKRTPFATDRDGRKYVEAAAIMSPMIPYIDGLPITVFDNDKATYLDIDTAIKWVEKEMQFHSREKYEIVLAVLKKFRDQPDETDGGK